MSEPRSVHPAAITAALRDPFLHRAPIEWLRKIEKRRRKAPEFAPGGVRKAKIAVAAGFTSAYLLEILPLFLAQRGVDATLYEVPYGTLQTALLDPSSGYHAFEPDVTLLLPMEADLRHLPEGPLDDAANADAIAADVSFWTALWAKASGAVVQGGFIESGLRPLDEADGLLPGGRLHHLRSVNAGLAAQAKDSVSMIDIAHLAGRLGAGTWQDPRLYRLAKQPFAMEALPELAHALASAIAGRLGKARKALILDLDNTLWGGVIGDDGLEGIELGSETANGESFVAFQSYIRSFAARGIVLAVCSKNHRETALEPFRSHGAMVLKEDDIACFVANFSNKADNIRHIAKSLNLGLDAFVFVDDSPVECALVRDEIPEVWTIELSSDPALFPHLLSEVRAFPNFHLTEEDRARSESYKKLGQLNTEMEVTTDLEGFLKGLEPKAVIESVRPDTISRISQLLAKTNQFKLNPTLFDAQALSERSEDVIALRLVDRLQDYGIVAVAVSKQDGSSLEVENWVMSCRAFSRRLEHAMREQLAARAETLGAESLSLTYTPSGRNGVVQEALDALGFTPAGEDGVFRAALEAPLSCPPHHMTLVESPQ